MSRWRYFALREDIRFRKLKYKDIKTSIEAFFVKRYLHKKKYLLWCCYNPYKSLINEHLFEIGKV